MSDKKSIPGTIVKIGSLAAKPAFLLEITYTHTYSNDTTELGPTHSIEIPYQFRHTAFKRLIEEASRIEEMLTPEKPLSETPIPIFKPGRFIK